MVGVRNTCKDVSLAVHVGPRRQGEGQRVGCFIEDRGSYDQELHMQKVLAQALDYVILKEWMPRNQNPTNCKLAVLVPLEQ